MSAEGTKMPEPIRAFAEHAKAEGHDTAYTYDTERSRWVFLNPMTADLWRYWQEATRQAMERAAQLVENYDTCGDHTQGWQDMFAARIRALADVAAQEVGK